MQTATGTPTLVLALTPVLALLGAAFGSAVLFWNNSRNIKIENITKERAKWRDDVRQKSLDVHKAAVSLNGVWLDELHLQFSLILNPEDANDREILASVRGLKTSQDEGVLTEFADRVSLLLKHDWERAKWEAKGGDCDFSSDMVPCKPRRVTYEQFTARRKETIDRKHRGYSSK
jgi:hypothetical protein